MPLLTNNPHSIWKGDFNKIVLTEANDMFTIRFDSKDEKMAIGT